MTATRIVGFSFFYRSRGTSSASPPLLPPSPADPAPLRPRFAATLLATGILPSPATASPAPVNTHATPIKALPLRFLPSHSALRTPWSAASSPLSQCDSVWGTPVLGGGGMGMGMGMGSPETPATPVGEWGAVKRGGEEGSSPVREGDGGGRGVMIGGKRRGAGGDEEEEVGGKRMRGEVQA